MILIPLIFQENPFNFYNPSVLAICSKKRFVNCFITNKAIFNEKDHALLLGFP